MLNIENVISLGLITTSIIISIFLVFILKNKKDYIKIIITKILLIISLIFMIIAFFIYAMFHNYISEFTKAIPILICIFFGIPAISIMIYSNIKSPSPIKYNLRQKDYSAFSSFLKNEITKQKYLIINNTDVKIYRKEIKKQMFIIVETRVEELTEEFFTNLYQNKIFPLIEKDFLKTKKLTYSLYVILIISVDRVTPYAYKFLEDTYQDKRFYKLPVIVSFGSNKVFLKDNYDLFNIPQYKILKNELKKIMNLVERRKNMKKIKIINNGFELDYLDDEVAEYSRERKMVNKIINLIDDYTCFVTTRCDDKILSELKIVNYLKTGKYDKTLELEEFPEIKDYMFEGIYFYFMPKGFEFNLFASKEVYGNKLYKKYGAKLCLELNEFGTVYITYNSMYDEQIRNIIGEENIKQPFFKRKWKK